MLKILRLSNPSCKKSLWEKFDPAKGTWIVSDAQTKGLLLEELLEKREMITGEPVMRAAELWRELLRQTHPELVPIGAVGEWAIAKKFLLENVEGEWGKRPRATTSLMDFCKQMAPFLTHETTEEILREFKHRFSEQTAFFEDLAHASLGFFNFCLQHNRVSHFFLPSLLSQRPEAFPEHQEFVFDMDAGLWESEKDVIQILARKNLVSVIVPQHSSYEKRAYQNLSLGVPQVEEHKLDAVEAKNSPMELWRCSSPDGEARKAVEKIAEWLRSGSKAEDICIAAPDISIYENILEHDLNWEGLSLNKKLSSPISSHRFFRQTGAMLHILSGRWTSEDLFEAFPDLMMSDRQKLKPAQDVSQISVPQLSLEVKNLKKLLKNSEGLQYDDFEKIILALIPKIKTSEDEAGFIQSKVFNILQKLKIEMDYFTFDLSTWIEGWLKSVARSDFEYKSPDPQGIRAVNFFSASEVRASKMIFLGVNSAPQSKDFTAMLTKEAKAFFKDTGFDLELEREDWTEDLDWFISGGYEDIVLSTSATDSTGAVISPSPYWLKLAKEQGKSLEFCDSANKTVWTRLQEDIKASPVQEKIDRAKAWPPGRAGEISSLIEKEMVETKKVSLQIPHLKFSPSSLEKLWACPFKYVANQGFKLKDDRDFEVEPTPQIRGQVLHSAAEKITNEGFENWTVEKISNLLDECAKDQMQVASDVWPSSRARMIRQLERFIDFELQWKRDHPKTSQIKTELGFSGYIHWDPEKAKLEFSKTPFDEGGWVFRGRVDRIDISSQGEGVLLDYKDRSSGLTNVKSWLKNGQFQLALYSQALKAGLSDVEIKEVVGAFYYSLRNRDRSHGFVRSDLNLTGFLPQDSEKNAQMSEAESSSVFGQINEAVGQALEKTKTQDWTPYPHDGDIKICEECSWKKVCRYHQLL